MEPFFKPIDGVSVYSASIQARRMYRWLTRALDTSTGRYGWLFVEDGLMFCTNGNRVHMVEFDRSKSAFPIPEPGEYTVIFSANHVGFRAPKEPVAHPKIMGALNWPGMVGDSWEVCNAELQSEAREFRFGLEAAYMVDALNTGYRENHYASSSQTEVTFGQGISIKLGQCGFPSGAVASAYLMPMATTGKGGRFFSARLSNVEERVKVGKGGEDAS